MNATVTPEFVRTSTDSVVQLDRVRWETYGDLRDSPENDHVRMTFDRGVLVLMSPSKRHERIASLIGQLIVEWALVKRVPFQSCDTVTFQRKDLSRALEPDKCYYIQHEKIVRDRDELDLNVDPPPDLVIEVDVASSSARKLELYAAFGVPEVWHWQHDRLQVLILRDSQYEPANDSDALSGFPNRQAVDLIVDRRNRDDMTLLLEFRNLIQ